VIELQPMDDRQFDDLLRKSIPRRADRWVERGIWTREQALDAARALYAARLPQGRQTRHHHFVRIVERGSASEVGSVWFTSEMQGGKVQFWIEWIEVDPSHRRRGVATEAIRLLEKEALRQGADRIGLNVWLDNPGAVALYSGLGFTAANMAMTKSLATEPEGHPAGS